MKTHIWITVSIMTVSYMFVSPASAATTYEASVVVTDPFGGLRSTTALVSTLPVTASDSSNATTFGASFTASAYGGAGQFSPTQPVLVYPALDGRAGAAVTMPGGAASGGVFEGSSRSRFVIDTIVISGPAGPVDYSFNIVAEGVIGLGWFGPSLGASAFVGINGSTSSSHGTTFFDLGSMHACQRGALALGFGCANADGTLFEQKNGMFSTLTLGAFGALSGTTPTWTAITGETITLALELNTSATAMAFQGGAAGNYANGLADFVGTVSFPDRGPILNLPRGYTANSLDGLIVNNRLVVPVPAGVWLFGLGLVELSVAAWRKARRR